MTHNPASLASSQWPPGNAIRPCAIPRTTRLSSLLFPVSMNSKHPRIDWSDLFQVKRLARQFGRGTCVIKHAGRANYNITHHERRDQWDIPNVSLVFVVK